MKKLIKENRLLLIILLLIIISVFLPFQNYAAKYSLSSKVSKVEEIKRKRMDYVDLSSLLGFSHDSSIEVFDNQNLDDADFETILLLIKGTLTLFSKLAFTLILLSLIQILRRWIRPESDSRISAFITHFLQLKDGKKDASAFHFAF